MPSLNLVQDCRKVWETCTILDCNESIATRDAVYLLLRPHSNIGMQTHTQDKNKHSGERLDLCFNVFKMWCSGRIRIHTVSIPAEYIDPAVHLTASTHSFSDFHNLFTPSFSTLFSRSDTKEGAPSPSARWL